ncbi:cobyrinate a,c-diamide synthase [Thiohalocapsa marina]|uniref:Cobyrinate a,c-diamide synthase n=1 Tax=Thiohalocapsa marina TaxID=424902 RepID=A0A5M8FUE5_9GAMM|nr:cobyrinate a,c-diamide synthase [Thiohalocapsa marina]KAA6187448.1 cobyrinate a,c-diamide synthase [Thiohalocapsa marina]
MSYLYLSAPSKSSGKTTLSIGLAAELRRRGRRVQPFKKGPDYIDPLWLTEAAGHTCLNLDFNTTPAADITAAFCRQLQGADIGLIEGNVGLFDSVDLHGRHSNAELARLLGAPVVLVVNAQGLGRGIAPLLLGYQAFDPALRIAGVVLNRIGGDRHGGNLRRVVEHYTDIPVLGLVPRAAEVGIEERHLGLMPSNEAGAAAATVERIRALVADHMDMERVEALALDARLPSGSAPAPEQAPVAADVRIGIARDEAFGFYYPDDLLALQRAGAELVPFSPVHDPQLPPVDGLFIGGGFPEYRMHELERNGSMRAAVADFIAAGGPVYAECGGLMYLARRLHWQGRSSRMCGVLGRDVAMHARPQGRGYVRLRETEQFPWAPLPGASQNSAPREIAAHEFHHSALVDPDPDWRFAYQVLRGTGIDGRHDGVVHNNLLASYAHLRDVGGVGWTARFVEHVRAMK